MRKNLQHNSIHSIIPRLIVSSPAHTFMFCPFSFSSYHSHTIQHKQYYECLITTMVLSHSSKKTPLQNYFFTSLHISSNDFPSGYGARVPMREPDMLHGPERESEGGLMNMEQFSRRNNLPCSQPTTTLRPTLSHSIHTRTTCSLCSTIAREALLINQKPLC